jgi:cobalt/nickel transport system permease protein
MHISEGVLSAPVLLAGAALSTAGVAIGLKRMDYGKIPEVAVLSSAFFVASLLRVPIGPANIHLTLNGLLGLLLGWMAFPSVLVALVLQALLFQFGGFTTLGVNALVMAAPAVLLHYVFRPVLRKRGRGPCLMAGFGAGALGVALALVLTVLALLGTGSEFAGISKLLVLAHLPAVAAEGAVSAFAVLFLYKVKPEALLPDAIGGGAG